MIPLPRPQAHSADRTFRPCLFGLIALLSGDVGGAARLCRSVCKGPLQFA